MKKRTTYDEEDMHSEQVCLEDGTKVWYCIIRQGEEIWEGWGIKKADAEASAQYNKGDI